MAQLIYLAILFFLLWALVTAAAAQNFVIIGITVLLLALMTTRSTPAG